MTRHAPILLSTLLASGAFAVAAPEVFTIKTLRAQMRYDVTEMTVAPGAEVKIVFENTDDMPHNIVFFQAGTDVIAACNKQMEKPEEALKRDWIPDDPRMWLHSKLLNPKDKQEITFKAPDKAGTYPYVCSFPGHAATMQGQLKVATTGPKLTDGKFQLYLGDWKQLPDFSKLTPHREGPLPDNLVEIKTDDYKNQFGVVYTGKLAAPKDAEYTFSATGDDGVRVLVDGKKVVEYDGIHPAGDIREGKIRLKEGQHDFRLEYFQGAGEALVFVAWRGADFTITPLSKWLPPDWKDSADKRRKKTDTNTGMPLTVEKEPIVYRNFIAGAGNRGIAVGYPGGASIAWSAESMNVSLVWRGAFMDAARHWRDRGGGHQPPLGFDVLRPTNELAVPFAIAESGKAEWVKVKRGERPADYQWLGYTLDAARYPTFSYKWRDVTVSDRCEVSGDAAFGTGSVTRTLKLSGNIPANAVFRVAGGGSIKVADGGFDIDGGKFGLDGREFENKYRVVVEGGQLMGSDLVVPAKAEIKVTYSWPHDHSQHQHAN